MRFRYHVVRTVSRQRTFLDIVGVERRLEEEAKEISPTEIDGALRAACDWFARLSTEERKNVGEEAFAEFTEAARSGSEPMVRGLALSAIRMIAVEVRDPDQARFIARVAKRKLRAMTGAAHLWKLVALSVVDEEQASALFEAAIGDRSYSDDMLFDTAARFICAHGGHFGVHGRLAMHLGLLVRAVRESTDGEHVELARAALTYFVLEADAIPDTLGAIGWLDDSVIAQRAIARIYPERGAISKLLDEVAGHWSFLVDMVLESAEGEYPISEFVVVNTALLLEEVASGGGQGAVVVLEEPGPLPFLCGFLRAIAEVRVRLSDGSTTPRFSLGDRLQNQATKAEVEFLGYCGLNPDGSSYESTPEQATYFRCRTGKTHLRVQPISHLRAFVRSVSKAGKLRRGHHDFEPENATVGPLDLLLGQAKPVVIPPNCPRVFVVMDPKTARELACALRLFGRPLEDIVPTSFARLANGAWSEAVRSARAPGGEPVVTVVKSVAEALELVEDDPINVAAVIARLRVDTTDASNIVEIYRRQVPVVAMVTPSDQDAHALLDSAGLPFWIWDDRWFGALHWPASPPSHPIADYERWLRTLERAKVRVMHVDLPGLGDAWSGLVELERAVREDDGDERLISFIQKASMLSHAIRKQIIPTSRDGAKLAFRRRVLDPELRSGEYCWSTEVFEAATRIVAALDIAIEALGRGNPKWNALQSWIETSANGVVICSPGSDLHTELTQRGIPCAPSSSRRAVSALVPFWSSRDRMDRLLHPPVANEVTILLYGPEILWYEAAMRRRARVVSRLEHITSKVSPFKTIGVGSALRTIDPTDEIIESEPEAYAFLSITRRASVTKGSEAGEVVSAKLIHFAGGAWAAFPRDARVHTMTHLLGTSEDTHVDLREVPAWELGVDDLVVVVRGSGRDAVRMAVDEKTPSDLRELASLWRRALARYAQGRHVDVVVERLRDAGCKRTRTTVSRWLTDESVVRPRHGRQDIEAVVRVTKDAELAANLDDCVTACDELLRVHAMVGREIVERIRGVAREWIVAGTTPDEMVEVDDRLSVVVVEAIDSAPLEVPRSALGWRWETG